MKTHAYAKSKKRNPKVMGEATAEKPSPVNILPGEVGPARYNLTIINMHFTTNKC